MRSPREMLQDKRVMLPRLTKFTAAFAPAERRSAVKKLFLRRGCGSRGEVEAMFSSVLLGLAVDFGRLRFSWREAAGEERYWLALVDCFVSLLDECGVYDGMVWDPLPRIVDPQDYEAAAVHSMSARERWRRLDEDGPGVSSWVLEWVHNKVYVHPLDPSEDSTDHSARNAKQTSEPDKAAFIDGKVREMLEVGAVVQMPEGVKPRVLTRLSVAPKPGGGAEVYRLILDMRPRNKMYAKRRMRMETLANLPDILRPGDFMWILDLKSAYYSVGVQDQLGECMGFMWRNVYYKYKVLPFGFSLAPYVFVKIGRQIVKSWRAKGPGKWSSRFLPADRGVMSHQSRCMLFLDDLLGAQQNFVAAVLMRNEQMRELRELGFWLSAKSNPLPFPSQRYLGMIVSVGSEVPSWHMPVDKIESIVSLLKEVQHLGVEQPIQCRKVAKCIGKLLSAQRAVPVTKLLFRELNRVMYSRGTPDWEDEVHLSEEAMSDLLFLADSMVELNDEGYPIWSDSLVLPVERVIFQDSGPEAVGFTIHEVTQEASAAVWGSFPVDAPCSMSVIKPVEPEAYLDCHCATSSGTIELTDDERSLFHVQKELLGVLLVLKSRGRELFNKRICLFVDSTTSVFYLVRFGGRSAVLHAIVKEIWKVLLQFRIRLVQVSHVKGSTMISSGADSLSRPPKVPLRWKEADRSEWRLRGSYFQQVQMFASRVFGCECSVDRMASRRNTRLARFMSVTDVDPNAEGFSAFSQPWKAAELSYVFPPFHQIPRVLQHVEFSNSRAVLLVPNWPSQLWFPRLSSLAVSWGWFHTTPGTGSPFERFGTDGWEVVQTISFEPILVAVSAEGN